MELCDKHFRCMEVNPGVCRKSLLVLKSAIVDVIATRTVSIRLRYVAKSFKRTIRPENTDLTKMYANRRKEETTKNVQHINQRTQSEGILF